MSEEIVIRQESELIVSAPVAAEYLVRERPAVELLEVVERGPAGPAGPQGEKGDTGEPGVGAANDEAEMLSWIL